MEKKNKTRVRRTSTHTAASYKAKYLSGTPNAAHNRLLRLARLAKQEATLNG